MSHSNENEVMERVQKMMEERSVKPLEMARERVVQMLKCAKDGELHKALNYLLTECWQDSAKPVLISLACEAVGGKPETTIPITAAMTLIAIGVGIHDDIIDESKTKRAHPTVYGKFGTDVALVAGRALMIEGLASLFEAEKAVATDKIPMITNIIENAFRELGDAEAQALNLRGNIDISPKKYMYIIRMKASINEAQARIGAIIGGGTRKEIEALGEYGRILGMLATLRDEFVDMFDTRELKHRMANECLPLPILCALQNSEAKEKVLRILEKKKLTRNDVDELADVTFETGEVQTLREKIKKLAEEAEAKLALFSYVKPIEQLKLLLSVCVKDFRM